MVAATSLKLSTFLLHISWISRTKRSVAENLVELKGEQRFPFPLVANISARSLSSADLLLPPALEKRSLLLPDAEARCNSLCGGIRSRGHSRWGLLQSEYVLHHHRQHYCQLSPFRDRSTAGSITRTRGGCSCRSSCQAPAVPMRENPENVPHTCRPNTSFIFDRSHFGRLRGTIDDMMLIQP